MSDFLSIIRINQKGSPEKTAELIRIQLHEWFKQERFQTVDEMLNVVGNNINEYLDYVVHVILDMCSTARPKLLHYQALLNRYEQVLFKLYDRQLSHALMNRINEAASIEHTIGVQVEKAEPTLQDEIKRLKEIADKLVTQRELEKHIQFHKAEIHHHTAAINEIERQLEKL